MATVTRLSPAAFAAGAAIIWGAAIGVIGTVNAFVPGYGEPVLALVTSLYPGYEADGTAGDLLLGTAYAVFDGLAAGFVFALLYNLVVRLVHGPPARAAATASFSAPADETDSADRR